VGSLSGVISFSLGAEGNTYSLLETQRLFDFCEKAEREVLAVVIMIIEDNVEYSPFISFSHRSFEVPDG